MNRFVFLGLLAVLCASSVRANPKNICEDDQKFKFDGLKVNSVWILQKQVTFSKIADLRIEDNNEFDAWICPAINKTMSQEDVTLYNHHILKIFSENFFNGDVSDFYQLRRYIVNIRDSFIETKQLAEDPKNIEDCRNYLRPLQNIINRVSEGYKFIDALTSAKESKLSPTAFPVDALRREIDGIQSSFLLNIVFSFRNKMLDIYYNQPLLFQNTFTLNRGSTQPRYLEPETTATLRVQLYIPLHNKQYDSQQNCLHLKDLPDFYQSL